MMEDNFFSVVFLNTASNFVHKSYMFKQLVNSYPNSALTFTEALIQSTKQRLRSL